MKPLIFIILWLFILNASAQNKQRVLLSDLYQIKTAAHVKFSPMENGKHELTRSGNNRQRADQMLRTMEFFERYKP